MKTIIPFFALLAVSLTSCDVKVDKSPPDSKTTIITPGKEEKKVENNTTIVNPPARVEKKVEEKTTIVNPPKP